MVVAADGHSGGFEAAVGLWGAVAGSQSETTSVVDEEC